MREKTYIIHEKNRNLDPFNDDLIGVAVKNQGSKSSNALFDYEKGILEKPHDPQGGTEGGILQGQIRTDQGRLFRE
jgi:hypothetical protein